MAEHFLFGLWVKAAVDFKIIIKMTQTKTVQMHPRGSIFFPQGYLASDNSSHFYRLENIFFSHLNPISAEPL